MDDLPPLPERRRGFFCTKCHGHECVPETLKDEHPLCRCGYLGFAQDLDFSEDQLRAYATEVAKQEREASVSVAVAAMTDEQRMELFSNYCRYCGCADPGCQCWNDE